MSAEILAVMATAVAGLLGTFGWVWRSTVQERIKRAEWERQQEAEMTRRIHEAGATILAQMKIRLDEKQVEIDTLRAMLAEERAQRARSEAKLDEAQRQIVQLQQSLQETQVRLLTATRELDKMHQLETLVGEQERQILTMREREQRALNDAAILERELMATKAAAAQWEKQHQALIVRVADLEGARAHWENEASLYANNYRQLYAELKQIREEMEHETEQSGDADRGADGADDPDRPDRGAGSGAGGSGSTGRGGDPAAGGGAGGGGGDRSAGGSAAPGGDGDQRVAGELPGRDG